MRHLLLLFPALLLMSTTGAFGAPLKGRTETLKNLDLAVQGETTASHKYELYAAQAEKEGFGQVAKLFRAVSQSEAIHLENHKGVIAKLGGIIPQVEPEPVSVGTTRQNLEGPIEGEQKEVEAMYPKFIKEARTVGELSAEQSFEYAKRAEKQHEVLFKNALKNLGANPVRDYLVNRKTGETLAVPSGSELSRFKKDEFIKIT